MRICAQVGLAGDGCVKCSLAPAELPPPPERSVEEEESLSHGEVKRRLFFSPYWDEDDEPVGDGWLSVLMIDQRCFFKSLMKMNLDDILKEEKNKIKTTNNIQ